MYVCPFNAVEQHYRPRLAKQSLGGMFRVLQWNVLAEGLAETGDFVRVLSPETLLWRRRGPAIVARLRAAEVDIAGLEEVNHFEELSAGLPEFHGIFAPKPQSPAVHCGAPPDGVALFVRRSRWTVISSSVGVYLTDRGTPGNQCYVVAALQSTDPSTRPVVVGATHLKAKRGFEAVREHQVCYFLPPFLWLSCASAPRCHPVVVCCF